MIERLVERVDVNMAYVQETVDLSNYRGGMGIAYAAHSHGRFLVIMLDFYSTGFVFLSINKNGEYCIYYYRDNGSFPWSMTSINQSTSFCLQMSDNMFHCFNCNNNFYVTIPDYFIPGGKVFIRPQILDSQGPCGVSETPSASYFDKENHIAASTFIQSFPEAFNEWVNIYKLGPNGRQLITGGYLGNFPNNSGGFNRISYSVPSPVTDYFGASTENLKYQKDKIVFAVSSDYADKNPVGWIETRIKYDILNCKDANNNTYVYVSNEFNSYSQLLGLTSHEVFGLGERPASVDMDDLFAFSSVNDEGGYSIVLLTENYTGLFRLVHSGRPANVGMDSNGNVVVVSSNSNSNKLNIYIGKSPKMPSIPPTINNKSHNNLVNYHRPVSPIGGYLT